jgi:hypothetical protein
MTQPIGAQPGGDVTLKNCTVTVQTPEGDVVLQEKIGHAKLVAGESLTVRRKGIRRS